MRCPPVLLLGCIIAGGLLHYGWPRAIASYEFTAGLYAGVGVMAAAVALVAWAALELRRHHTSIEPGRTPRALVTSGPYRFSRNPIYVGQLILVTSFAIAFNSVWMLLFVPVLFALLDRLVIVREEAVIASRFPEEFARYRARVRRWL